MSWFVDDRGHALAARNILEAGGLTFPDVIKKCGFVYIEENDRTLSITINPSRIRTATLAATFYFIADHMPKRVVILDIGPSNRVHVAETLDHAYKALDEMSQYSELANIGANKDSARNDPRAGQMVAC